MEKQLFSFLLLLSFVVSVSAQDKEARKIEEISDFCCEYVRSVLDGFLAKLQNNPGAKGGVIFYDGKNHNICNKKRPPKRGELSLIVETVENHFNFRSFPTKEFVWINGGYREDWTIELWIIPKNAKLPEADPTIKKEKIKFRSGKAKDIDLQCEP